VSIQLLASRVLRIQINSLETMLLLRFLQLSVVIVTLPRHCGVPWSCMFVRAQLTVTIILFPRINSDHSTNCNRLLY